MSRCRNRTWLKHSVCGIDEEGCEAAAFTVISIDTRAMMPEDIIEIKIDRPFVFAITGADGLPMFIGVVNVI